MNEEPVSLPIQSSSSPNHTPSLVVRHTYPDIVLPMSNPIPLIRSHRISKAPLWHMIMSRKRLLMLLTPSVHICLLKLLLRLI